MLIQHVNSCFFSSLQFGVIILGVEFPKDSEGLFVVRDPASAVCIMSAVLGTASSVNYLLL